MVRDGDSCYTLTYFKETWNHVLTISLNGLNRELEFQINVSLSVDTMIIYFRPALGVALFDNNTYTVHSQMNK